MSKLLFALKDHFQESQLHLNRVVTAASAVFILFFALIVRLVYLQIDQHALYKNLSLHNQVRINPLIPPRGLIFDRKGVLLAENTPAFSLEITPEQTTNIAATLKAIDAIMPITETERQQFYKQLRYKRRHEAIPLRLRLTEEEVAKFSVEKHRLPGVSLNARLTRHYPMGEEMAHALGYVGPINEKELSTLDPVSYRGSYYIGKTGVEKFYEDVLHGVVGYQQVETNAKGQTLRLLNRTPPISGADLYLSLDSELQRAAYQALKDLKGAIVVIDPNNGDVLALVSSPSFDPNLFTQGIDVPTYRALQDSPERPLFNRAIRGQYPPGSTIKPLVALQGLEVGMIDTQYHLFDPGWYQLNGGGRRYRDWIYHSKRHGHGWVDLAKAIAQSCDTYFFSLAHKLGVQRLHEVYSRFGLGNKTDIDVSGEAAGLAPSPAWKKKVYNENWYAGDTLNIGIGQGMISATPLQIAQVAAMLATKGKPFKPRVVTVIDKEHTDVPVEQPPQPLPPIKLRQASHWDIVINAMKDVVHLPGGTAYRISHGLKYHVAGKTGTAQVFSLKQNEKYNANQIKSHLRDHSWFIAFAPIEQPKVALAVLIENKHTKSGADIARLVLDGYFKSQPTDTTDMSGEDEYDVGGEDNDEPTNSE